MPVRAAPFVLCFSRCFCFHVFFLFCFLSVGLSPRDLILHFRHKVEATRRDPTVCVTVIGNFFYLPFQVLILFKLILLEKKVSWICGSVPTVRNLSEVTSDFPCLVSLQVLFYVSPVSRLVGALMTVLSLFPGQELFSLTLK